MQLLLWFSWGGTENLWYFSEKILFVEVYNIRSCPRTFLYFGGILQENLYHFFRSIGKSESEDPTLTETLVRRLS